MTEIATSPVQMPKEERMRPPTRELLPTGNARVVVAAAALLLAVAALAVNGFGGWGFVGVVLCPPLVVLSAIDFEHHLLPNDIVLPMGAAVSAVVLLASPSAFLPHLAVAAAVAAFFLVFAIVTRGGVGLGDVKLSFVVGIGLGLVTLPAMLLACVGIFVASVWVLARQGLSARKAALPFGPFIAAGAILAYFLAS